jgi:hypothetical protein
MALIELILKRWASCLSSFDTISKSVAKNHYPQLTKLREALRDLPASAFRFGHFSETQRCRVRREKRREAGFEMTS